MANNVGADMNGLGISADEARTGGRASDEDLTVILLGVTGISLDLSSVDDLLETEAL